MKIFKFIKEYFGEKIKIVNVECTCIGGRETVCITGGNGGYSFEVWGIRDCVLAIPNHHAVIDISSLAFNDYSAMKAKLMKVAPAWNEFDVNTIMALLKFGQSYNENSDDHMKDFCDFIKNYTYI